MFYWCVCTAPFLSLTTLMASVTSVASAQSVAGHVLTLFIHSPDAQLVSDPIIGCRLMVCMCWEHQVVVHVSEVCAGCLG